MLKNTNLFRATAILALIILFSACKKNRDGDDMLMGPDVTFYGLSTDNKIMRFNGQNTNQVLAQVSVSGLASGESLLGIDFRPATGQLYAIGSSSRLYTINVSTGAATAVGAAAFSPVIAGNILGFDFNPTVDRIRLVTSTGQNLRLHPETGAVAFVDGSVNGVTGVSVVGSAYTENRAGATTTALFNLDASGNRLLKQTAPNEGTQAVVGSLGVDIDDAAGFDISPAGVALAAMSTGGMSGLYTIDLATGAAAKVGSFGIQIRGLAIPTN
ncbi:DUF4394 domain-containing protein [Pedobacter sp. SYP-B3415]|uniref:DUF4394 domain-containing protein n=1 Tax=Pedobacter sp. SYP-B3415 TaxID=2496641 RepID=UPI00101D3D3D|nr:DUF4394 domain-containing protein [Pedobacter sp. SYP-B3415]